MEIIERNLQKVLEYNPYANFEGVNSPQELLQVIGKDPAFAPFSLAREKYVKARIGGNSVTSLHKKIGDMYEEIIITLLSEKFGFTKAYLKYTQDVIVDGKVVKRTTDGRIMLADVEDDELQNLARNCVSGDYRGLALEVRSCYQIGDSKRIQADVHMASALKILEIEPIMLIFCETSLKSPVKRLSNIWTVREGKQAFDFVEELTEFDLFGFLMKHKERFDIIITQIFDKF